MNSRVLRISLVAAAAVVAGSLVVRPLAQSVPPRLFETAARCQACHNGLVSSAGEALSIGVEWRASMMAHAARDPYWQAAVRRETRDHPAAASAIEHECSRCHMPMAHLTQVAAGGQGNVFAQVPGGPAGPHTTLAADGVSCTVCHQIADENLGSRDSFTGHFTIAPAAAPSRMAFGPFDVRPALQRIMESATGVRPTAGSHMQSSEVCATCHTLFTHALDDQGRPMGELPEQVPYLEWKHSAYRNTRSCQSCHMPPLSGDTPLSTTMPEPRAGVSRHTFRGSNFWMLRVLDRYRSDLAVPTAARELQDQVRDTMSHLQTESASLEFSGLTRTGDGVAFELVVTNRAGHKLPTAYPSRRVWVHVTALDAGGGVVWESGKVLPDGRISGNDNDVDADAFEPHYATVTNPDQVQIFEAVMVDARGRVTTGLLAGVRYVKDNRLLPQGFEKQAAESDVAVHGHASADANFTGGRDIVRYEIAAPATVSIRAELLYQSIGFRWAENFATVRSAETDRFVTYYRALSDATVQRLASAETRVPATSARR